MASAPGVTEAQLREFALPETFARGREFFESGAVSHLRRRGAELQAAVAGSQDTPYRGRCKRGIGETALGERDVDLVCRELGGCLQARADSSATRRAAEGGERGAQDHTPPW
jgi:hypothetical protein